MQSFFNKQNLIDYGIEIKKKKKLTIKRNYVATKFTSLLNLFNKFLISRNINKIYLAGFDGFSKDEPNQDSTFEILESF